MIHLNIQAPQGAQRRHYAVFLAQMVLLGLLLASTTPGQASHAPAPLSNNSILFSHPIPQTSATHRSQYDASSARLLPPTGQFSGDSENSPNSIPNPPHEVRSIQHVSFLIVRPVSSNWGVRFEDSQLQHHQNGTNRFWTVQALSHQFQLKTSSPLVQNVAGACIMRHRMLACLLGSSAGWWVGWLVG